jgi:hypothetical protein
VGLHGIFKSFWSGRHRSRRENEEIEENTMQKGRNVASRMPEVIADRSLHHRSVTATGVHD